MHTTLTLWLTRSCAVLCVATLAAGCGTPKHEQRHEKKWQAYKWSRLRLTHFDARGGITTPTLSNCYDRYRMDVSNGNPHKVTMFRKLPNICDGSVAIPSVRKSLIHPVDIEIVDDLEFVDGYCVESGECNPRRHKVVCRSGRSIEYLFVEQKRGARKHC